MKTRKTYISLAILGLILGLAAACQKKDDASSTCNLNGQSDGPATAIINGKTLTPSSRVAKGTVFVITKMDQDKYESCTGILVAQDLVLTAAHCVRNEISSEYDRADKTKIVLSNDPVCSIATLKDQSAMMSTTRIISHSDYVSAKSEYDLALIYLATSVPADRQPMPVSLEDENIAGLGSVFVAGYGRQNDMDQDDSNNDAKLRFTSLHTVDPRERDREGESASKMILLRDDEGSAVCQGDSGGPAMIMKDGVLTVIGVASFVYNDGTKHTCLARAAYTRTSAYKDWLRDNSGGRIQ